MDTGYIQATFWPPPMRPLAYETSILNRALSFLQIRPFGTPLSDYKTFHFIWHGTIRLTKKFRMSSGSRMPQLSMTITHFIEPLTTTTRPMRINWWSNFTQQFRQTCRIEALLMIKRWVLPLVKITFKVPFPDGRCGICGLRIRRIIASIPTVCQYSLILCPSHSTDEQITKSMCTAFSSNSGRQTFIYIKAQ